MHRNNNTNKAVAFLQSFAISLFLLLTSPSSSTSPSSFIPVVSAFSVKTTTSATAATTTTTTTKMATTDNSETTTTNPKGPNLPIPDPIYSDIPGTWAYDTMSRRVNEEILQRTYEDNKEIWENNSEFAPILKRFNELRNDLKEASTTKLKLPLKTHLLKISSDNNSNVAGSSSTSSTRLTEWNEWNDILQPFIQKQDTWLTAPWMVTEFYVYRRLLIDVIKYWDEYEYDETFDGDGDVIFNPGYLYDPFQDQKYTGLVSSVASAENVLGKLNSIIDDKEEGSASDDGIKLATSIALWGNKMDLSLWPADASSATKDIFSSILDKAQEGLLNDDSELLVQHCMKLHSNGGGIVDIIVDNAGFELITDLILGQYLIDSGIATTVRYQLKSHPTFVSDALEKDLLQHINYYAELGDDDLEGDDNDNENENLYPNCKRSGLKWKQYIKEGTWICKENNFWNQAYPMWKMTEPLRTEMKTNCDLAFVKGDANYRRLLGDCKWDFDTKFQDVVGCYFPCPVCALRTLKAEIGCGIPIEEINRASKLDENWQTNGRFGVIQFGTGAGSDE